MTKADEAAECFKNGFNCSQAVLSAYCGEFGLEREQALRVAGAFGAGMGRMCETCGAVTGAFMVIGLKYGKVRVEDEPSKEKAYALVRELAGEFKARNGSIVCRELLGCDMGTPGGMKYAKEHNLHSTMCPKFVRDAAEIVGKLIE
ncbi:MAG TPA: C-GCAxxG-C-C family protein [Methanocella sp.]|jgi:C_GCAxxG_C_C family probable redox protein|nr:C-GCAxxG-C-C family protein [Methanocella sp.]